jgi:hypothetical protein
MALPCNNTITILEQNILNDVARNFAKAAERQVNFTASQSIDRDVTAEVPKGETHIRAEFAKASDQTAAHHADAKLACGNVEAPTTPSWVEAILAMKRGAHEIDQRIDSRSELQGPWRWLQTVRKAQKQWVAEQVAQPTECMTNRRLAQAQTERRLGRSTSTAKLAEYEQ